MRNLGAWLYTEECSNDLRLFVCSLQNRKAPKESAWHITIFVFALWLFYRTIIYRSGAGISPNKIELFAVRKYIGWRRN